jgi:hypothetical protein
VWPGIVYQTLDAPWAVVVVMFAVIFLGGGRAATEIDARFIGSREDVRQKMWLFTATCAGIVLFAFATRVAYYFTR